MLELLEFFERRLLGAFDNEPSKFDSYQIRTNINKEVGELSVNLSNSDSRQHFIVIKLIGAKEGTVVNRGDNINILFENFRVNERRTFYDSKQRHMSSCDVFNVTQLCEKTLKDVLTKCAKDALVFEGTPAMGTQNPLINLIANL